MTITARYVDTCLPDYLQDHHNRPGEMLVGSYLGMTKEDTALEMLQNMDDDSVLPPGWDPDTVQAEIAMVLNGVDLRMVDAHGNRVDTKASEAEESDGLSEAMVWVLLTWSERVVKLRMVVDVAYRAFDGVDDQDLKLMLEDTIRQAAANGALTGSTDAEVESWGATAEVVT